MSQCEWKTNSAIPWSKLLLLLSTLFPSPTQRLYFRRHNCPLKESSTCTRSWICNDWKDQSQIFQMFTKSADKPREGNSELPGDTAITQPDLPATLLFLWRVCLNSGQSLLTWPTSPQMKHLFSLVSLSSSFVSFSSSFSFSFFFNLSNIFLLVHTQIRSVCSCYIGVIGKPAVAECKQLSNPRKTFSDSGLVSNLFV